jgi:hypothetical protein
MTATSDVDMLLILPEGGFAGDADSLAANYGFGTALIRASRLGLAEDLVVLSHKIMADHGGRLQEGFVR